MPIVVLRDLNNAARLELDAVLFVVEPNTMNKEDKDQKPGTKYPVSDRVLSGHRDQRSEVTSGKLWISSWSIGIWRDGESACASVCFKGSGFCYDKGSAQANADDEAIHVGPHCISHDEKGKCTSENFVTAGLSQVDGVKYLDHKQYNVVFSKDSDAYGQTNIGAMLPCSRWNSNFEAQIDYDILPDGSEKDNAEATSDEKRGSNGKIGAGVDVALRPVGVPPVSTLGVGPPRAKSFQINRMR